MNEQSRSTQTIYVLDDDEATRESVKDAVESIGLHAETFAHAEELFRLNLCDLTGCLVLDIRLPGIDGLEVQRHLLEVGCALPVVFISAYADVWTVVQAMKNGAYGFFGKPFSSQELLGNVQAALRENDRARRAKARKQRFDSIVQKLTPREREILARIGLGFSNKLAAEELGLSVRTIEFHRANLRRKLGTHSREAMATLAIHCFRDEWHRMPSQVPRPGPTQ